uniref:uncharacterized protein LOC101311865 n=1 Tax=Fragaria vesca subsp. vesca TaxID=101020 RepID=UPI0005C8E848|nr:PREDICTED: uncharacterized protein LOC101311865 [Fragaria vesca subsp. vesca]
MTTNKAGSSSASIEGTLECCMCGDFGFSYELFQCKACQFRSQHRYCSNLYPKAESYRLCNWCLTQKEETKEKSQNSSNSSSSCKKDQPHQEQLHHNHDSKVNKVKKNSPKASHDHHTYGSGLRGSMKLQPSGPIKKQRSLDHHQNQVSSSPKSPSQARKRIITNGANEEAEKIRRTRSEEISNINRINKHGITRQVFRNKVRRYKLLDEVSSQ